MYKKNLLIKTVSQFRFKSAFSGTYKLDKIKNSVSQDIVNQREIFIKFARANSHHKYFFLQISLLGFITNDLVAKMSCHKPVYLW